MAQREIPQEWRVLMDRKGIRSMRKLAERADLGHTTVVRVIFGAGHETTDEVLQKIADALGVEYRTLYRLVGRGTPVGERWNPPASSALLSMSDRALVEQLIETLAKKTHTERVDHPERGHLRLAADNSHGPAESQRGDA